MERLYSNMAFDVLCACIALCLYNVNYLLDEYIYQRSSAMLAE